MIFNDLIFQNMLLYQSNDARGMRSRAARLFFEEFSTRFWEEPGKYEFSNLKLNFIIVF